MNVTAQIAFGEVRTSKTSSGVMDTLGGTPSKLPTLLTVCNGDLGLREVYSGELKSDPLQKHLATYLNGKKCAAAVKLDASTDFSKLSASALKTIMKERGIPCKGCAEKDEFVAALKQYVSSGAKAEL